MARKRRPPALKAQDKRRAKLRNSDNPGTRLAGDHTEGRPVYPPQFPVERPGELSMEQAAKVLRPTGDSDSDDACDDLYYMHLAYQRSKRAAVERGVLKDERDTFDMDFLDDFEYEGQFLNFRQKLFVAEFLVDLSPKLAALRAGYGEGHADHAKERLVESAPVREAIRVAMGKRMLRLRLSGDRVLEEMAKIAFSNISDVVEFGPTGITVKSAETIPADKRSAIREITETRGPNGTTMKIVMHDKKTALDSLARHLGLFNDKLEINASEETVQELMQARERVINAKRSPSGEFIADTAADSQSPDD